MLQRLSFVLGGAASGKSNLAERLTKCCDNPRVYIATAQPFDEEMTAKIAAHRDARAGDGWQTIEAPLDLAETLGDLPQGCVALVDCLTLWLTNCLLAGSDLGAATIGLLDRLDTMPGPVILVSNEVGQGIVPDNALSRRFRAAQGGLNRDVAARADCAVAVMAGLPIVLKGALPRGFA